MPNLKGKSKIHVSGGFTSGKSTWMRWYAAKNPRVWVWDPVGEFPCVNDIDQAYREYQRTGKAAFCPPRGSDLDALFSEYLAYAELMSGTVFEIDEAWRVIARFGDNSVRFNEMYRLTHKVNNGVVIGTQGIGADVDTIARMAHHYVIFKPSLERDWEAVIKIAGKDNAAWLRAAAPHSFLLVSPEATYRIGPDVIGRELPKSNTPHEPQAQAPADDKPINNEGEAATGGIQE